MQPLHEGLSCWACAFTSAKGKAATGGHRPQFWDPSLLQEVWLCFIVLEVMCISLLLQAGLQTLDATMSEGTAAVFVEAS